MNCVSRIPVREALRALAAEGLVKIEPRRGASGAPVAQYRPRNGGGARHARRSQRQARRATPRPRADPKSKVHEGNDAVNSGQTERLVELNSKFHELLGNIAANSVLQDMMRSLRERTGLLFAPANLSRARLNWDEHAQILQAVIAGDADLAALLATRHVFSAAKAVENMNSTPAAEPGEASQKGA